MTNETIGDINDAIARERKFESYAAEFHGRIRDIARRLRDALPVRDPDPCTAEEYVDQAIAQLETLTRERDELAAELGENDRTISALIFRAQDAEFRRNDAESELIARRASDEDVLMCAVECEEYSTDDTVDAAYRLLAADWLKREGGS